MKKTTKRTITFTLNEKEAKTLTDALIILEEICEELDEEEFTLIEPVGECETDYEALCNAQEALDSLVGNYGSDGEKNWKLKVVVGAK